MGDQWKINTKGDVVTPVEVYGSTIMQPVDIQSRLATTIQTHNAISIAGTNGFSNGANIWIDCNGYDRIGITMTSDAATSNVINLLWSNDGTNDQGFEVIGGSSAIQRRALETAIKARYLKVQLQNGDAAAHTMSGWVYLKA